MRPTASFRHCLSTLLAALALGGGALPAAAQSSLPTSPALACLVTIDGLDAPPAYPEPALLRKEGGTVRVQLDFSAADAAPSVKILSRPLMGEFDDTVTRHVKRLRVPCMQPGDAPVQLTQDYVFDADQQSRVIAAAPRDNADPARAEQLKCMAHKDGIARPEFPHDALRLGEKGTMIVRLRFASASLPPTMTVLQTLPSRALRRAVTQFVDGLRVPCLGERPLETLVAYKYVYHNGDRVLLRDSPLLEVLAAARDLKTPARFDFRTMGCPFELRLTYHQPFSPNRVEQLDSALAAREPFMDWLKALTLDQTNPANAEVFGARFLVAVPCAALDL